MKIHEYQAKEILKSCGVPVPKGGVAETPEEGRKIAEGIGDKVTVVKAQIHAGGRGKGGGVKKIRVASTTGSVAIKALEVLKRPKVIFVSHSTSFSEPNVQRFTEENRKIVESKGGMKLTAIHVFAGLSRALRNKTNTVAIGDLVAETLGIFGHWTRVACEISMMAAGAGLVRTDENIISVGSTSKGSDTALVLTPVTSQNFFVLKIKEILYKSNF